MHSPDRKPTALGYALLTYMTLVIAAITLIPFEFRAPSHIRINLVGSAPDILTNIVLFLPLGFLFQLTRRRNGFGSLCAASALGVLVSAALETCQLFLPGRDSSLVDVATNGMGTLLGAATAVFLRAGQQPDAAASLFALEMPLMNTVYLFLPLLWLGSIGLGDDLARLLLMILLGVAGGGVVAAVCGNGPRANRKPAALLPAVYTLGWFAIGTLPAAVAFPLEVGASAAGVVAATAASAGFWRRAGKSERRFEFSTLKKVLPVYGAYLLLLSLWPTNLPLAAWTGGLHYQGLTQVQRIVLSARLIEVVAAFTLLGYLVAGRRGRRDESAWRTGGRVLGGSLAVLILTTALRHFFNGGLFAASEMVILTFAALYGALIYRLQLSAVKQLRGHGRHR
jgi:VanZ family protein